MKNVLNYLEESARKYPNHLSLIHKNNSCSYYELLRDSQRIGSHLNISKNEVVVVYMDKSIYALKSFFGIVYAGGMYCLVNPQLNDERCSVMVNVLQAKKIITDHEHFLKAKELFNACEIILVHELLNQNIDTNQLDLIRMNMISTDPLYTIFTSGSTGIPKGVVVSHEAVIDFIDTFVDTFHFAHQDIFASQAPFDFDVSVKDIYSTLKVGGTLVLLDQSLFSRPKELIDVLVENKVTVMIWAVSALCLLTSFHAFDYQIPEHIHKILFSGEVMPYKHLKQYLTYFPDCMFVNLYGPTEITCNCLYHILSKSRNYKEGIPLGKHFDNEEVMLVKDGKLVTEVNEIGEIVVRGRGIALGYYANQKETDLHFKQNPLHDHYRDLVYYTGDLARIDQYGDFYFCGRKDFQIKYQGHRIEIEEIERKINQIEGIERCCIVYVEEKSRLGCFFIGSIEAKQLNHQLRNQLPIFMIPNRFKKLESFPLTKNGKIDRKILRGML